MPFTLVLGGVRSGKSALAQRMAEASGRPVTVIVTAEPRDEDMRERIRRHQEARPAMWGTVEAPVELLGAVAAAPADHFLLIDCLTLWVSNLLERGLEDEAMRENVKDILYELEARTAVVVSNEVGLGVIPDNALGRRYEELLGRVNTDFAAGAERTLLMVAGRAIELVAP
jgi:adenosyl cobinamide kinase/adenosyl cobinamide phosphate guanylyltransferase